MLKKKIADLDESFTRVGAAMNYLDLLHRLIRFAATWILIGLIQFGLYMNWLQQQKIGPATLIAVVNYVYGTNIGTLIVYEFLSYVDWLQVRFKHTNDLLKTFLVDGHRIETNVPKYYSQQSRIFPVKWTPKSKHESQNKKKVHLLQEIRFLHLQLCGIVRLVNRIFNHQLTLLVSVSMLYLTVILYYVYIEIRKSSISFVMNFGMVVIGLLNLFFNFIKLTMACFKCEHTAQEAHKLKEIIHAFSVHEFDSEMKDEILGN
ncbi:uncharacterized protein LOC143149671 [Ptiloglossa arizonensis]|uniref:uncharacterized protein LOC143149671 n=1 Tax=Ptiloglossa arizonensis TaxID=3350558 RepID=UPI003FA15C3C